MVVIYFKNIQNILTFKSCFKSFKNDMQEARVKEYTETDLHRILRQKDPD